MGGGGEYLKFPGCSTIIALISLPSKSPLLLAMQLSSFRILCHRYYFDMIYNKVPC